MDRYLMMTLLSLLFLSCSHEENSLTRKDGDWDDDIKLSKHEIVFGSDEGSEVINSEGLWRLLELRFLNQTFGTKVTETSILPVNLELMNG